MLWRSLEPDEVYVDLREIRQAYAMCCEEYRLTRVGPAQLQGILAELAKTGLIHIKRSKDRLLVSLPEIPVDNLRKELETIIESDEVDKT